MPLSSFRKTADALFMLSESRGKEASGIVLKTDALISILKEPVAAHQLIQSEKYHHLFTALGQKETGTACTPLAFFGHSRLVTNGRSELNANNQPVGKNGAVGVHNGIIVNDAALWKGHPELRKSFDVDTEVFLALLQQYRKQNIPLVPSIQQTFSEIEGSASIAVLFDDIPSIAFGTNTGSLYFCKSFGGNEFIFASEMFILKQIIGNIPSDTRFDPDTICQVKAGRGYLLHTETLEGWDFPLNGQLPAALPTVTSGSSPVQIQDLSPASPSPPPSSTDHILSSDVKARMTETWENLYQEEGSLRRCTRCLLPETLPFITFDEEGVCTYCRQYEKQGSRVEGEEALKKILGQYRTADGGLDCLVGFSGGRDSSYGLYYLKKHEGMNPLTFIYDWGMVTDLARRNQARVCGILGIEQIVVSADIRKKREYIRKNLEAWLRKPDLGMVTILMAGDKEFYRYFHKIRKETGVKLFVFCGGYVGEEATGIFKLGFCGVNRNEDAAAHRMTGISIKNKMKLLWHYMKNYLTNPAYFNSSILDTLLAFYWSYLLPDDYVYLYRYLPWDEHTILSTIQKEFDWELETDTIATWRTDDGTAALYNYIYLTMAGFTEFDVIRSQQVREGKLTREEAYDLIKKENLPRFASIEWYADVVGVDANRLIATINSASRLYSLPDRESRKIRMAGLK